MRGEERGRGRAIAKGERTPLGSPWNSIDARFTHTVNWGNSGGDRRWGEREIYPGVIMGIKGFTWVLKRRFVTMDDPRSDCKDLTPWLRSLTTGGEREKYLCVEWRSRMDGRELWMEVMRGLIFQGEKRRIKYRDESLIK